jgi:AraC-like DNA-binding protein
VLTFFFASGPARSLVHGPQSYQQVQISLIGSVDNFTIHFQPSGLYRLFGVPMREFADASHDAEGILGQIAISLRGRLGEAVSFAERVRLTDSLLLELVDSAWSGDPVGAAANHVFAAHGKVRVGAMAAACNLSVRQFERRFQANTGLPPKLYARITRFNAAVYRKLCRPDSSWADIAVDCGFSDQMHLVRDFREFAGDTPARFEARLRLAPELRSMFATADLVSAPQSSG